VSRREFCSVFPHRKVCFAQKQQALVAAAQTSKHTGDGLEVYKCKCGYWHMTSREQVHKVNPPSAAKLRRRLENYGREIAAAQQRLEEVEAKKKAADAEHADERKEIQRLIAGWRR
jgi:hypothetical protein